MDLVEMGGLDAPSALRHWYYRSKYRLLRKHLDSLPPSARSGNLADFGCGAGVFLSMLEKDAFMTPGQMLGIDHSPLASATCVLGRSAILPAFPVASQFDMILAMDVLEHCADDLLVLRDLAAHCRDGGWI
ncbi:MAG: class I SAM-dependent methyltransferase, partial [Verrucomicrobiia bacterium]